jgi:hypothetical protein
MRIPHNRGPFDDDSDDSDEPLDAGGCDAIDIAALDTVPLASPTELRRAYAQLEAAQLWHLRAAGRLQMLAALDMRHLVEPDSQVGTSDPDRPNWRTFLAQSHEHVAASERLLRAMRARLRDLDEAARWRWRWRWRSGAE